MRCNSASFAAARYLNTYSVALIAVSVEAAAAAVEVAGPLWW